jgi:hypothetical protein
LQYGRKSTLSKIDIEHAYKIVPISPDEQDEIGDEQLEKHLCLNVLEQDQGENSKISKGRCVKRACYST